MIRKLRLALSAFLLMVAGGMCAQTKATLFTEANGYTTVTSLPTDAAELAKYYYVIADANEETLLQLADGKSGQNGTGCKVMEYVSVSDPLQNQGNLWIFEYALESYHIRSMAYSGLLMQTEWNAAWNRRTNNQPHAVTWSKVNMTYADGAWTFENGHYTTNYFGYWGKSSSQNEVASNKTGDGIGKYTIYAILRDTYKEKYIETHFTEGTELDVSNFLFNPGVQGSTEYKNNVEGYSITASGGNLPYNAANACEFYNGTAANLNFTMSQTANLPNGKYKLVASMFNTQIGAPNGTVGAFAGDQFVGVTTDGSTLIDHTISDIIVSDGTLTFGYKTNGTPTARWFTGGGFTLYYVGAVEDTELIAELKTALSALITEATPLTSSVMAASVKTELNSSVTESQGYVDSESATKEQLESATERLTAAKSAAEASIKAYDNLEREIVAARKINIDELATYEAILTNGTSSDEQVVIDAQNVNVAVYNKVRTIYTKQRALPDTWEGTITKTASGQHWSDNASTTYYDANNGWWAANPSLNASVQTSVTLPAGDYVLMAAGRYENAEMKLYVGDTEVSYKESGDVGYGIETSGQANFSEEGTYANNDLGRGWQWQYVPFHLDEETTLQLKATMYSASTSKAWGSFSDLTLYMTEETFNSYAYKDLEEALNKYVPFTESGDYVTTYNQIKDNYNNKTYTDADAIAAAVSQLETAYKTYIIESASLAHPADMTDIISYADCTNNDPWIGTGRPPQTGEHWSGDASRVYFYQNVEPNAARVQSVTFEHAGLYLLKTSVRVVENNAYAKISVGSRTTATTTVTGRTGGTIATDGTEWESVEAGIAAGKTFANNNNGYGWIYNYVYFMAEAGQSLDISINLSHGDNGRLANAGGMTLLYCGSDNISLVEGDVTTHLGTFDSAPTATTPCVDVTAAKLPASTTIATSDNPNRIIYANAGQVSNTQNVVVDGTCANLVVKDGYPFVATTGFNATSATYTMTAVASNGTSSFGTLCLPFPVTTLAGKAYTLTEPVSLGNDIVATEVTSIAANTPVVVTAAGTYSGSGAVPAIASGASFTNGQLVGVYTTTTAPEKSYVLQKHGSEVAFYLVTDVQPTVNPFRAYIKDQSTALQTIRVIGTGDNDGSTGIDGIYNNNGATETARYNAAGTIITAPQKGLNIIRYSDGTVRKVFVK